MAVIKDYYIGSAHIMIDETYCRNKTSADIKEIYNKIAADIYPILLRNYLCEIEKNELEKAKKNSF